MEKVDLPWALKTLASLKLKSVSVDGIEKIPQDGIQKCFRKIILIARNSTNLYLLASCMRLYFKMACDKINVTPSVKIAHSQ